jgi:DNA-binding PadR family transcriptional regulator
MKVSHSNLRNIIQNILLESKENGQMSLYNTELYRNVKKKTGKNISHRDYNAALDDMVHEGILQKTDKRGSKVFYSLTENAVREYQHNLLGIDKKKERLRMLYQLLFFYEVGGKMFFRRAEDFNHFLESVGLSLQDLKPSKTVEMPEENVRLTYFEHVKLLGI